MILLGIDIGGSGIKGAPVDTAKGGETRDRVRVPTPQPAAPEPMLESIVQIAGRFDVDGPVGLTFPGVVVNGEIRTAANLDKSWIGVNLAAEAADRLGRPVTVINDADAAGVAEVQYGAARGVGGVVLLLTFGTGIGSALFMDGALVPNTELGHLEWKGQDAEKRAAASVREAKGWSFKKWAGRVGEYIDMVDYLLSPRLVVIGGGIAKNADKWLPHLKTKVRCVPAALANEAGIVGAAVMAAAAATPPRPSTKRLPRKQPSRPRKARGNRTNGGSGTGSGETGLPSATAGDG